MQSSWQDYTQVAIKLLRCIKVIMVQLTERFRQAVTRVGFRTIRRVYRILFMWRILISTAARGTAKLLMSVRKMQQRIWNVW